MQPSMQRCRRLHSEKECGPPCWIAPRNRLCRVPSRVGSLMLFRDAATLPGLYLPAEINAVTLSDVIELPFITTGKQCRVLSLDATMADPLRSLVGRRSDAPSDHVVGVHHFLPGLT